MKIERINDLGQRDMRRLRRTDRWRADASRRIHTERATLMTDTEVIGWIVRKGEDARNVAPPQEADAIAKYLSRWWSLAPQCAFCGEDHEGAAVMAFRPEPHVINILGICERCAEPSDEPRQLSGWAARTAPKPVLVKTNTA